MKAMILAAGYGTRLRPLTQKIPKALLEIRGQSLLEIVIHRLKRAGFRDLVINVHHHADQIINYLDKHNKFGMCIDISYEREQPLGTGGALKEAFKLLIDSDAILIHNVDIISDIDLLALYRYHQKKDFLATLAVRNRHSERYLLFNQEYRLCGWQNKSTGVERVVRGRKKVLQAYAFSGIQVISPEVFRYLPEKKVFSLIDLYLTIAKYRPVGAYDHSASEWIDVGKPQNISVAVEVLANIQNKEQC